MTAPSTAPPVAHPEWHPTRAVALAGAAGVVVLAAGVLLGRADVALLGVPLVLGALAAHGSAPSGGTELSFVDAGPEDAAPQDAGPEARPGTIAETLRVRAADGAEAVQVRVHAPGHRPAVVVVPATGTRDLRVSLDSVRTGPSPAFEVYARGHGVLGAHTEDTWVLRGRERLVLPEASRLQRVPLPTRLRGLTGPRRSRRLGDGTELRDIHPMGPGDRLRRVDWRATARMSPDLDQLFVRRTLATAEAGAVLVMDSRDDVGPDLHTWRGSEPLRVDEATSLDLARHAAASVAAALVANGDRVGLEDLARRRRPLAPATGQRHLRRILHALALSAPVGEPAERLRPPQLPNDVIVYLFTTLLDDAPLALVRSWREQGVPVVVVDTLPGVHPVRERHLRLAWRITSMERADRTRELEALGVPVVRWTGQERVRAARRFEELVREAERHRPVVGGRR